MAAYSFTAETAKADLGRFEQEAKGWKPAAFDTDAELRLDYYLDRQLEDVKQQLKARFPQTHLEMVPVTLPVTRSFVNEQARVFLNDTVLDLVDEKGNALPAEHELTRWWSNLKRDMGLAFRLKNLDRYVTLHRTCFLRLARVGKKIAAQIFFAHRVDAVFDPAFPMDLDMAFAVRLEVGSDGTTSTILAPDGNAATRESKRYEFWCGRPEAPFYSIVKSDGTVESRAENPYGPLVPLVMFTAHTDELGPFTLANQGLHLFNRAINIAATDEQHIAECQGYGQLFITTQAGGSVPGQITVGPNRAAMLPDGCDAKIVNGNAPIAELLARLDASLKRAAVLHGIPPGAVSLEARAVASGIALQIEMRPLLEQRTDMVDVYQGPVRRTWTVLRAVHNATRQQGEAEIAETVEMRWKPGEVTMPSDPHVELDDIIVKLTNNLMTRPEALAQLRRLPLDEAKKLAAEIATENAADTGKRSGLMPLSKDARLENADANGGVTAGARAALATAGAQRRAAAAAAGGGDGSAAAA